MEPAEPAGEAELPGTEDAGFPWDRNGAIGFSKALIESGFDGGNCKHTNFANFQYFVDGVLAKSPLPLESLFGASCRLHIAVATYLASVVSKLLVYVSKVCTRLRKTLVPVASTVSSMMN